MYLETRVESWQQARFLGDSLSGCLFRGHAEASWRLETRLDREAAAAGCTGELRGNRERHILRQFTRRAHQFLESPPGSNDFVEWLAIMQHHGGPTRLLDFTHSFYVAAFFAIESASADAVVWAYNKSGRLFRGESEFHGLGDLLIDDLNAALSARASGCIAGGERSLGVLPVEPERLSERLAAQQGAFLFPMDVATTFEENMCATLGSDGPVLERAREVLPEELGGIQVRSNEGDLAKIFLPKSIHVEALTDLWSMNVSAASLFPGLDGFARSLSHHIRGIELYGPPELRKR